MVYTRKNMVNLGMVDLFSLKKLIPVSGKELRKSPRSASKWSTSTSSIIARAQSDWHFRPPSMGLAGHFPIRNDPVDVASKSEFPAVFSENYLINWQTPIVWYLCVGFYWTKSQSANWPRSATSTVGFPRSCDDPWDWRGQAQGTSHVKRIGLFCQKKGLLNGLIMFNRNNNHKRNHLSNFI